MVSTAIENREAVREIENCGARDLTVFKHALREDAHR
jgi:hypothetical protein